MLARLVRLTGWPWFTRPEPVTAPDPLAEHFWPERHELALRIARHQKRADVLERMRTKMNALLAGPPETRRA